MYRERKLGVEVLGNWGLRKGLGNEGLMRESRGKKWFGKRWLGQGRSGLGEPAEDGLGG